MSTTLDVSAPSETLPDSTIDVSAGVAENLSPMAQAVAAIVAIYVSHFEDESKRSFAIARKTFTHMVKVRKILESTGKAKWTKGDWEKQCLEIRTGVRMEVSIKEQSIKVADWTRCYVLRELLRADSKIGDGADQISMFEYLAVTSKAMTFDPVSLSGSVKPVWVEFLRDLVRDRLGDVRVTAEEFKARVAATVTRVDDLALGKLSPEQLTKKVASDAVKADTAARTKSVKELTDALDEGFKADTLSPADAVTILESVANKHGIALPKPDPTIVEVERVVGFDPANCTVADALQIVPVMFANGKFEAMRALRDELDRVISRAESMRSKMISSATVAV